MLKVGQKPHIRIGEGRSGASLEALHCLRRVTAPDDVQPFLHIVLVLERRSIAGAAGGEKGVEIELVELTGVSAMTVYRDIEALEDAGVLVRHRGQVTAVATGLNEIAASIRVNQNAELKQQVARVVADRIRPGSSIMVDDSTTALWVLRQLDVVPITVVMLAPLLAVKSTV